MRALQPGTTCVHYIPTLNLGRSPWGSPYGGPGGTPAPWAAPLKPTVSPRGRRGAHPRLHLGVLALPGDGGHLTDFVANLWSIGAGGMALVTLIIQAKPKPWFF